MFPCIAVVVARFPVGTELLLGLYSWDRWTLSLRIPILTILAAFLAGRPRYGDLGKLWLGLWRFLDVAMLHRYDRRDD